MSKRLLLKPVLAVVDSLILVGSFLFAYWLRFDLAFLPERPVPSFELYTKFSLLVGLLGFTMLYFSGLYRLQHLSFRIEDFFSILRAVTFTSLIIMVMNFVLRGYITDYEVETYSRLIIFLSWFLSFMALTCWRAGAALGFKQFRQRGKGLKNVIIIGTDQVARGFFRAVRDNVDFEYRPLGFVCNGTAVSATEIDGLEVLGDVGDLPQLFHEKPINEVVLACMDVKSEDVARIIKICDRSGIQFSMIPGFFEILTRQMSVQEVADIPIFQLEERIFQRWGRLVKRGTDIAVSLLVIVLFLPFWLVVAISIKIESRGGGIFKQDRVGKGVNVFQMWKFRSMYESAEDLQSDLVKEHGSEDVILRLPGDVRVTWVGRLIRRFSIDEIPQLFNVLKGEMSLVGPRPHMPAEVAYYKDWQKRKFDVLPGITGFTQIRGRKDLSLDEMVRLDIYYIENWTPLLDFQILIKTLPAVLTGRGAY